MLHKVVFYAVVSHHNRVTVVVTLEESVLNNMSNCTHMEDQNCNFLIYKMLWDKHCGMFHTMCSCILNTGLFSVYIAIIISLIEVDNSGDAIVNVTGYLGIT